MLAAILMLPTLSFAQRGGAADSDSKAVADEYLKRIDAARTIGPLGDELFGDHINAYTGALEFSVLDVTLPGNSALPVEIRRRLDINGMSGRPRLARTTGWFGDWDLDVPHMHGVFAGSATSGSQAGGWMTQTAGVRCNQPSTTLAAPPASGGFAAEEFWQGTFLHLPAHGDQELLHVDASVARRPADGATYRWATKDGWYFSCVPGTNNSVVGDSFVALSPAGVRYTFNHYTTRGTSPLTFGTRSIGRSEIFIWPTRVEDRFGNWVEYRYNPGNEKQLTSIVANDGRELKFAYIGLSLAGTRIASVTDGTRTWRYTYNGDTYASRLVSVVQPDGAQWTMTNPFLGDAAMQAFGACNSAGWLNGADHVLTMTHPSGAVGTFTTRMVPHGRTYVPRHCVSASIENGQVYDSFDRIPVVFATPTIVRKVISGPALDAKTWTWSWPEATRAYEDQCSAGCPTTKVIDAGLPDGTTVRSTFGIRYGVNEGALLKTEHIAAGATTPLATTEYEYQVDATGQAYPSEVAKRVHPFADPGCAMYRPLRKRAHTQQGVTFTWEVTSDGAGRRAFDAFGLPTGVRRASSLGFARTDALAYHHDTVRWVIGQAKASTNLDTGLVESRIDYDAATAMPVRHYAFGKLRQSLTYHADGAVASVADGKGNRTLLAQYKRGIPQRRTFADGTFASLSVDDSGRIGWAEDELGHRTCYAYDAMDRITKVTFPSDTILHTCDESRWNPQLRNFAPSDAAELGIPPGHWKETVRTGSGVQVAHYDALWRPVVTERFDETDKAGTLSQAVTRYAPGGGVAFQSYPLAGVSHYATVGNGTRTTYDGLGRPTRVEADSELGLLVTRHDYLEGFQTRTTSPRGQATTVQYQVFDEPRTDHPRYMAHPEGAHTDIPRDVFGKPTSITRRTLDRSVGLTRTYAYNAAQELCRSYEPETGTTLTGYDVAGNLAWSASGLPWNTPCEDAGTSAVVLARKSTRAYDQRNRLVELQFADDIGEQVWRYTPDGLPAAVWTYNGPGRTDLVYNAWAYNSRGLPGGVGETLHEPGWTWALGYGYDRNGFVTVQINPDTSQHHYAVNGLGQVKAISGTSGNYVSGARYYPNGALKQFTYGNGLVHALEQNLRGLPDRSRDAHAGIAIHDEAHDYDAHGNVVAITDGATGRGQRGDRTMAYDGLDRLTAASSPMFAAARYEYDVLDNLKRVTIGGTSGRDHWYCHDGANRLTNVKTGGCGGASVIGLGYDAQGNLTNKNGALYTFSQDNRLRAAVAKESYRYDAAGRRVTADSPTLGKNRSFYRRDGSLAFRHDGRRQMTFAYVYLAGSLVATREQSTATAVAAMKYHHTDALGTPVATTDASRNVVERSEYEPYGKLLNRPANDGPGYTGHVEDAQTGLVYMQQRYFDPICGCFLSVDPVTAHSLPGSNFNRYWYANNNPYTFSDPDGRYAHILIGGGVGAAFGGGLEIYRQLRTDGEVTSWRSVGIETAKGGLVGGLTAAVPGSPLAFGGTAAKRAVGIANAIAAGASGEVGAQVARGEVIDPGKAMDAGLLNSLALAGGALASPLGKAAATTHIPGNPGFQVKSLRGTTFTVGATRDSSTTSKNVQQIVQDGLGAAGSAMIDGQR